MSEAVLPAPRLVRTRLSVMMFLEYFIWSAWFPLAGFMPDVLGFSGKQAAWVMLTTAIGAMVSPLFVGLVADRFFSTERVLAVLHILGGACLLLASFQSSFVPLLVFMVLNGTFYMPTLALTNSLAFRNIPDSEKDFPIIRVWGTIGWVVAGLIVGVLLGQKDPNFVRMAAVASVLMGIYCLTLPHTPPKRDPEAMRDPLGLRALKMLREPSFAIFCFCGFLVCVVLSVYWVGTNLFLVETDRPAPAALMTLGQISEIFFMASMPWFLAVLGLKRTLLVGILAWVVRYACFASLSLPLVIVGLLLHGICYDFFFVAAFIYVDTKAPADLRASAQSLITWVLLGAGMFVGMLAAGPLVDGYQSPYGLPIVETAQGEIAAPATAPGVSQPDASNVKGKKEGEAAPPSEPLPDWPTDQPYTGWLRYLDLSTTIRAALFGEEAAEPLPSLPEQLGLETKDAIKIAEVEALGKEHLEIGTNRFARSDFVALLKQVDADRDGRVTRPEWRAAQAHRWPVIWLWPLVLALVTGVLFFIGFHDNRQTTAESPPDARGRGEPPGSA